MSRPPTAAGRAPDPSPRRSAAGRPPAAPAGGHRPDPAGVRRGLLADLRLSAYWFSQNFLWGAMLTVVLPTEVLRFVPPAEKAAVIGAIAAAGAAVATVVHPLAGACSDRTRSRWGRRRPYVLGGSILAAAALLVMAAAPSLQWLALGFLALQLCSNVAYAAYQAYIPDLVAAERRGSASGYMGLMTMLGSLASLVVAGLLVRPGHTAAVYPWLAGVLLAGAAVTVWTVPEGGAPQPASRPFWSGFWVTVRAHPDFWWVLATRALVMLAFYTTLAFLAYFLKDVAGIGAYVQGTAVVSGVAVLTGAATALVGGRLSDRLGRRPIVSAAGVLMGLAALALTAIHAGAASGGVPATPWAALIGLGLLFGVGYGAYTSVDWALAIDVLPAAGDAAAKDLGIWSMAVSLPQVLAPALGGLLITTFDASAPDLGYRVVYGLACAYALAGSALVWRVRSAR